MTRRLAHARGGPLEAHEASYQRVVATVRRVGIGAGEQLVEAALRIRFRSRNAQAKLPEPWRADRDKQRCDAPSMLPQVVESRLDQGTVPGEEDRQVDDDPYRRGGDAAERRGEFDVAMWSPRPLGRRRG